jgi:pimeloyl-ACP methyl ester carboxylesterase
MTDLRGPLEHIQVGEIAFGYHTFGDGPPIVLLNGNAMCMSLWTPSLLRALSEHFRVTLFDYHGMGRSTAPDNTSWQIESMATTTIELLDALRLDRPHLLGWSTGGELALTMALLTKGRVGDIISVAGDAGSSHFVGDREVMTKIAKADPLELLQMMFPPSQASAMGRFVEEIAQFPQDEPSPEVVRRQDDAWRAWLDCGIWDRLPEINNRVLLLTGDQDVLVPPENATLIASRIPGARVETVADAGHAVLLQEPDTCADLIRGFIERE